MHYAAAFEIAIDALEKQILIEDKMRTIFMKENRPIKNISETGCYEVLSYIQNLIGSNEIRLEDE